MHVYALTFQILIGLKPEIRFLFLPSLEAGESRFRKSVCSSKDLLPA